ncbi:nitronate monooxygenase [Microbacteriaceae bacterium K1510]|nr:nitronate monooxygenase [Microbacteriaceae bacterium K1510]
MERAFQPVVPHMNIPPPPLRAKTPNADRLSLLRANLRLPVIAAPMFLISGPELVIAACKSGIIGCFPAANARELPTLDAWCDQIAQQTADAAPWAMNMITHSSYARFTAELEIVARYQPPLLITALGSPARTLDTVHGYGGLVFADVTTPRLARKAINAGADGLVLVCAGAGGHTGSYNNFAFVAEVRTFWDGPIVLSGGIGNAASIMAAQVLGADLAYMGTRFIAAAESLGEAARKDMTVAAGMEDIITSAAVTGVPANWMLPSLKAAGFTPDQLRSERRVDFTSTDTAKPWKNIWGAGHAVGAVNAIEPVATIVERLVAEYTALITSTGFKVR